MADYQSAGNALKAELARIQGLVNLVEVFTDVGSLEQAAVEAKSSADAAKAELADIAGQRDKAKADLAALKQTIKASADKASADADAATTAATETAAKIIADAEAEASAAKSDAVAEAHLSVTKAEAERDVAQADRDTALRELQDYLQRVEAAKAELAKAQDALTAIKAQVSKLVGA